MSQGVLILGRQPALGLAELESLYGAAQLRAVGLQAAVLNLPVEEVDFQRIGGSIKLCRLLAELPTTKWAEISNYLIKTIPDHLSYLADGKLQLGLSTYGFNVSAQHIMTTGLQLKKVIRGAGRSVRLVPNQEPALNSAQVLHNNLIGPLGWELVLIKDGHQTLLAQTVREQNIAAYTARDQARPKRDARVGMLPPKLAQIIINLASAPQSLSLTHHPHVLLDPFCGTGVILQEALLMGYDVYGTDVEQRMVDYSIENVINWFNMTKHPEIHAKVAIALGDATTKTWEDDTWNKEKQNFDWVPAKLDFIASETYLGRPFSAEPASEALTQVMHNVDTIHRKFLQNLARQTTPGFRLCIAVPAWRTKHGLKHLKMLDSLEQLGYTRVSFVHVRNEELVYYRENQIVARELVVLTRK